MGFGFEIPTNYANLRRYDPALPDPREDEEDPLAFFIGIKYALICGMALMLLAALTFFAWLA